MKTLKKIAIVASNSGLGHVRRSVILANLLSEHFDMAVYCPEHKAKKFKIKKKIKIIDFKIEKYQSYIFNKKNNIHNFFKFKKKYDLILSDNYPEILNYKNNSLLFSNFFWHDILRVNTDYYKNLEKKIAKRPIVVNYLFVSKYIKKKFKTKSVGFYGSFIPKKFKKKTGVLISFGTAKIASCANKEVKKFIENLSNLKNNKIPIYIEPRYYDKKLAKNNIFEANYDNKMFSNIAVAIIKPGLGTITDCLSRGITILTYTNNQNKEFKENSIILEKNNLGINFNNLNSALNFSLLLVKEKKILKKKFLLSKELKWNGEKDVIKIINEYLSNKLLIYSDKYEKQNLKSSLKF